MVPVVKWWAPAIMLPLVLVSCGGGGDSGGSNPGSTAGAPCKAGDIVGKPASADAVPPCANNDATTLTYGCYPKSGGPQKGSFYMVQLNGGGVLYGKPGGRWVTAKTADKLDETLVKSIGC
jgi:hypothetical protein